MPTEQNSLFPDHGAKMPLFPTYIALLSDKVFVGFVKSAENYTNQCAAKDGLVIVGVYTAGVLVYWRTGVLVYWHTGVLA